MKECWKPLGSALLLASLPAAWSQKCLDHPEKHVGASVRTSSGMIEGHSAPRRPAVSEYLGIPYASPPIGDLRFAPPVTYHSDEIVHAAAYVCITPLWPLIRDTDRHSQGPYVYVHNNDLPIWQGIVIVPPILGQSQTIPDLPLKLLELSSRSRSSWELHRVRTVCTWMCGTGPLSPNWSRFCSGFMVGVRFILINSTS